MAKLTQKHLRLIMIALKVPMFSGSKPVKPTETVATSGLFEGHLGLERNLLLFLFEV